MIGPPRALGQVPPLLKLSLLRFFLPGKKHKRMFDDVFEPFSDVIGWLFCKSMVSNSVYACAFAAF